MSAAVFIRMGRSFILPERLAVFVFISLGALCGRMELFALPPLPETRLLIGILLGTILLFAASGFGLLLIPAETLLFGRYFQFLVPDCRAASMTSILPKLTSLVYPSILFLSVFLAATYGLGASSALRCALFRGSPSARSRYQRQLSAAALCSLLGLANVFYFT